MSEATREFYERQKKDAEIQLKLWNDMVIEIFGQKSFDVIKISNQDRIIDILNKVGQHKALNHMFMPSSGGLDFIGAKKSFESDKIELNFDGRTRIVKAKSLSVNLIGDNPEWWYFRLNTLSFDETDVYKQDEDDEVEEIEITGLKNYSGEELLELEPLDYVDRSYWDLNYLGYDENGKEIKLPENARIVVRQYSGGDFVIFSKSSRYNLFRGKLDAYDGRHNKYSDDGFHSYIAGIVKVINDEDNKI